MGIKANNHFVPRFYLKNFSENKNKIWTYKTLVPDERILNWTHLSINKKAAIKQHLYTSTIGGQENDELEEWFNKEFETKANNVILKAINNARMTKEDWKILVRFLASQYVRTPAHFLKRRTELEEVLPILIRNSLEESIKKLENHAQGDREISDKFSPLSVNLPFKVTSHIDNNKDLRKLQAEILLGREMWLFEIKRALTYTAKILHQHKWTILLSPQDMSWVTSDNPVIQLNFCNYGKYNLSGRWGSKGTEIMLPLSPRHLLYTQVDRKTPRKGSILSLHQATFIQKIIIENAYRMIFASKPNSEILKFIKREVNYEKYKCEQQAWAEWHEKQTKAELDFV